MDRSKDDQFLIRSDGFNPSQILFSGGAITEPQTPSGTYMRQSSILKRSVTKFKLEGGGVVITIDISCLTQDQVVI